MENNPKCFISQCNGSWFPPERLAETLGAETKDLIIKLLAAETLLGSNVASQIPRNYLYPEDPIIYLFIYFN